MRCGAPLHLMKPDDDFVRCYWKVRNVLMETQDMDEKGNFEDGLKVGWWVSGVVPGEVSVQWVRPCLAAHSSAPFILCPTVAQSR